MSLFRFWRRSIPKLLEEWQLLEAKTETAKEVFKSIPIDERQGRLNAFRKWLELCTQTNLFMIEVVNRFSPSIGASLKRQILNQSERNKEVFEEETWKQMRSILSEQQFNEHVSKILETHMDGAEISQKEVEWVFVSIAETLRRVKGELPLEPQDRIKEALGKRDSRLAEVYEGAYRALESDNPDRYRHCAASMRKMVDGMFGQTVEQTKETITSHVKTVEEIRILESLLGLVRSIDNAWNEGVHSEIQYETAILAIQATELLISYLFSP